MPILPNTGIEQPDEGADDGVWDTIINADLALVDTHDHTTGKGVKVPTAGVNINADLDFNNFSAVDLRAAVFTVQATFATTRSLWVRTSDNGLMWTDATGASWKLADSTGINIALVGGIKGDYASVSASFYYDDANKAYRALQAAPTPNLWASVKAGDLDLYEKASGIATFVRLKSPAALAATYDITWPGALPGAAGLVQSSTAGVLSFNATGNRLAGYFTTIDANAAVTATDFRYVTAQVITIPPSAAQIQTGMSYGTTSQQTIALSTVVDPVIYPLSLRVGDVITGVKAWVNKTTSAAATLTVDLRRCNATTGAAGSGGSGTLATNNPGRASFVATGVNETVAADLFYVVHLTGSGTTGDSAISIEVSVTRP